ncbi:MULTISPECIES: amino acid adenylation domain-containing protein [unclassified Crossiella]|uniref:amino acid adenylation domain-containing protein n=1 Tax=unclassified Crossiella TaxID=2620835 RepID=UPI001FFF4EE6|nr:MULTISPECIES: amino acid adenylation domain-containing protein [unclassified Crossiella]MCK2241502.1 amino acid adenylation domain-containing protein [Crossiella sp. S99.2]MCK2255626.1 amino acid adenylation domain-containing protein [Crossiella sp. S99.1]
MTGFVDELLANPPHTPAIITPDRTVSYGELRNRIVRLAQCLVVEGLRPEQVCAIAVPRGVDAVVAMAAVLHAGGAFLTLDIDQPPQRLAAMLHSGQTAHLLTTSQVTLSFPGRTTLLDRLTPAIAPLPPVSPRSLAYVSHTSGSTGTPNAVLIERRGLDSYLRFLARDYDLGPHTTAVQLAPLGYDASIRDIFAPLLAGRRLVLAPRESLLRANEFAAVIRQYEVNTVLSVTPSFLTFLAQYKDIAADLHRLRLVVSSGESLRPFLAAGGRDLIAGSLVNQYGPTECTMTSTRHRVPVVPDLSADHIGLPVDGVTAHLLDDQGNPVPPNTIGEIHLGGLSVARGYADRPGLTADRFRPDPFGEPGSRRYRTGDLARRTEDGILEYLGRVDRQIKIRGYRVDPAEVEAALLTHPAVTGAVITAATDDRGRVHLIAHITGDLTTTTDADLRTHLGKTLPPHLMPRRFARIDQLPTTSTGKTDRKALAR